jgi:hypothetical protein
MFEKTRIKWAFKFGWIEHFASRILFITILLAYVTFKDGSEITRALLLANIVIWLIYYFAHRLEKWLHTAH